MSNRRRFLRNTGAFALGSLLLPAACAPQRETNEAEQTGEGQEVATRSGIGPIGLQLYSIRDVLEEDLRGNLQQLAEFGYKEVESYPGRDGHYYGLAPEEFSGMVSDVGMTLVSSHFGSNERNAPSVSWERANLTQNFEGLVEQAAKTGQKFLVCSSLHPSLRTTMDDLRYTAELFNRAGEICSNAGMTFGYHNHAFEFETVDNQIVYDFLLENTDPNLVKFEMDMYWLVKGNHDPKAYFDRYPNRFVLGHVKDMSKEDPTQNAILGTGSINYEEILAHARKAGMKHFLVEQETYTTTSMEAMRRNAEYLLNLTV